MVIETIIVVATTFAGVLLGAFIGENLGVPQRLRFPLEAFGIFALLSVLAEYAFLAWGSVFLITGVYVALTLLLFAYIGWNKKKTLSGQNGDVAKWVMQLQNDEDQLFMIALNELSQEDIMEVGVIAETRGEFRERMVERFEEQADEQIPADFA